MTLSLILEIFLAILLVACLIYCWRVEKSLSQFRASRAELEASARELVIAVSKAEGAIKGLRVASLEAGQQLQERIEQARALTDELQIMGGDAQRNMRAPQPNAPRPSASPSRSSSADSPMWNR